MFQQIVVPLDGSVRAEQALPVAAHIARACGGSVLLLQVVTTPIDYGPYSSLFSVLLQEQLDVNYNRALDYLARISSSKKVLAGVKKHVEVLSGDPAESILSLAQTHRCDLIVLCSHGPTGVERGRRGSVAQKVAYHSPVPVLVLRAGGVALAPPPGEAARPIRALIGLDGSAWAEEALVPTAHLVTALSVPAHGALHLLTVISMPVLGRLSSQVSLSSGSVKQAQQAADAYLHAVADRLRQGEVADLKLSITSSVAIDVDVAGTIIRRAEHGEGAVGSDVSDGCDLIALATHGRSGVPGWVMGSVTERVLGVTKLPLLVVRPRRQRAETRHELHEGATTTTARE